MAVPPETEKAGSLPLVPRIRRSLEYRLVKLVAHAPRSLRSSRQIAREACEHGALQKPGELAALLKLIGAEAPSVVVEIGTARGGTLYAFSQVLPSHSFIVSIDLPGGAFGGGYGAHELQRLRRFVRAGQAVQFLRVDSHLTSTKDALVELLDGRPIDFLFIDGDHTYEGFWRFISRCT